MGSQNRGRWRPACGLLLWAGSLSLAAHGAAWPQQDAHEVLLQLVQHADTGAIAALLEQVGDGLDPEGVETRNGPPEGLRRGDLQITGDCLCLSVKRNELGIARLLLEAGAPVNRIDVDGCTALHHARSPEMVEILVDAGAKLNPLDRRGQTPAEHCSRQGHRHGWDVLLALARHGGKVTYRDAIRLGELESAKALLPKDLGGPIPFAAISDAIDAGSYGIVRWLVTEAPEVAALEGRAPQLLNDSRASQLVVHAIQVGELDSAALLLAVGVQLGRGATRHSGWPPQRGLAVQSWAGGDLLDSAVHENDVRLIAHLLGCGFDPNQGDRAHSMATPRLHRAAELGHVAAHRLLMESGAVPDAESEAILLERAGGGRSTDGVPNRGRPSWIDERGGVLMPRPMLQPTRFAPSGWCHSLGLCLRQAWAKSAIVHGAGSTSLHAMVHSPQTLRGLVEAGHPIDARRRDGKTPLQLACKEGAHESILVLIQGGANPNLRTRKGRLPLEILVREVWSPPRLLTAADVLIEGGADPSRVTLSGLFAADLLRGRFRDPWSAAVLERSMEGRVPRWLAAGE